MTYMTPRRRAIAKSLPYSSSASSQSSRAWACAFCFGLVTSTPQSQARPSMCSLVEPGEQARASLTEAVPLYAFSTRSRKAATPGFRVGEQRNRGWYGAGSSMAGPRSRRGGVTAPAGAPAVNAAAPASTHASVVRRRIGRAGAGGMRRVSVHRGVRLNPS